MEAEKLPADRVLSSVMASLLHQAYDLGLMDLVSTCKSSLAAQTSEAASTVLSQHEVYIQTNRSAVEASSKWQLLTNDSGSQSSLYTNFQMRFTLNGAGDDTQSQTSISLKAQQSSEKVPMRRQRRASLLERMTGMFGGEGDELQPGDYEEVTSAVILNAPISDICVIQKSEVPPAGYYRISKTPTGKKANVNTGSGGTHMYLCIKKDSAASQEQAPITSILLVFADRGETLPPFYSLVRRSKYPCNFNLGTSGERVYLAYKRERQGNPLTDIQVILPGSAETTPPGFALLDKSPTGLPANLNNGTGGSRVYLCYKQTCRTLRVLKYRGDGSSSSAAKRRSVLERYPDGGVIGAGGGASAAAASESQSPCRVRTTTADLEDMLSPSVSPGGNRMRTATMDSVNSGLSDDGLPSAEGSAQQEDIAAAAVGRSREPSGEEGEREPEEGEGQEEQEEEKYDPEGDVDMDEEGYGDRSSRALLDDLLLDREDQPARPVTDAQGTTQTAAMCEAIYAILTGLRVRYSTLAQTSIQGLMLLLKETDMFIPDLHVWPNGRSLTLLHLCLSAVCERLEMCIESETRSLLFFLFSVVKVSKGSVHPANIQRIFKAYAFVLQCQAARVDLSSPEGALQPTAGQPISMSSLFNEMPPDMTALTALKDIMRTVFKPVEMLGENCDDLSAQLHYLPREGFESEETYCLTDDTAEKSESYTVAHEIVLELLDTVLDAVEMARITEVAQKIVSRTGLTVANSTYWSQVYVIGNNLFVEPRLRSCYLMLCSVLKMSWTSVRLNDHGAALPRDLNLKLMGLQAVIDYLSIAGELQRSSEIMGFQVRRLVVPCILANVPFALQDHRIFTKLMWLMSLLWKNWRTHTHLEFAILVEQLIIPVMQASSPRQIQPIFQMIVLQEVVSWFDQPALLVEMFVNFDMDRSSMSHWNVFSHLVRTICSTARKISTDMDIDNVEGGSPETGNHGPGGFVDAVAMSVTPRGVHIQALEEACRIAKALMDAAGHAYLIVKDEAFRTRSTAVGVGWEENENDGDYTLEDSDHEGSDDDGGAKERSRSGEKAEKTGGVRFKRAMYKEREEILKEAISIYHAKDKSLIKAVRYLVSKQFMEDTPQDIAQFLRVHRSHFDPPAIGDFLGEGGQTPQEIEYWSQIRFRYSRAISFIDMDVESALRLYLTGSGFRLPGEAQKVDRFVEVFVKVFWQDNSGTERCPFRHPDTVHLLTYAIIMLNTDHHRANVEKKHANRKMTLEQFIKNLRKADMGYDIDPQVLRNVFDAVHLNAIELQFDDDVTTAKRPAARSSVLGSIGFSFAQPTSGKSTTGIDETEDSLSENRTKFCKAIEKNLRDSRDLMRSLSSYVYHFSICGVDTNISLDLVSFMYETVWSHFRVVGSALLVKVNQDMFVTFHALDLLCYNLTAAIFLDMKSQKMVLADQLLKFQTTFCSDLDTSWYTDVCECSQDECMEVISRLHKEMVRIKDSCQQKGNLEKTIAAAKKIEKSANVLNHNAYFVREGDVEKVNRKGGASRCRLFLFSDQLIYTKVGGMFTGGHKVRGQLSLRTMSVSDIDTDPSQRSLYIEHPYKNFVIMCDTPLLKNQWLRDIHQTINNSNRRASMAETEAARAAAAEKSVSSKVSPKDKTMASMSPNSAYTSPKARQPESGNRKASLSVDLAEEHRPISTSKSPRRMSGGRLPTSPAEAMDPRTKAAIASQAAFLRTALNSSADRPLRMSLTRDDVKDVKKISFAAIADEFEGDGDGEPYDSPMSSPPTSPTARVGDMDSTFSAESYPDEGSSEHSNLSSDTDSDHEEAVFARIKAATDHQRSSTDLSQDPDYMDL